jgi:hypothetical protein
MIFVTALLEILINVSVSIVYIVSGARGVISRGPNATSRPGAQNDTRNDIRPYIAPNQLYKTIETTVYL